MAVTRTPEEQTLAPVDLMFLLSQASHALGTEMTARLAELGVTPRETCVLRTALGGELTQNHLAELCALDKTTMVVTVDGLEAAGLAERRPAESDRRARIITVTEAGARMVDDAQAIIAGVYDEVLATLSARQRDAFLDALVQLVGGPLSAPSHCEKPPRRRAPRAP
jgi:MarR family transcriptional regulator for hemolysin